MAPKSTPEPPTGPFKGPKKTNRKRTLKKTPKKQKNKPVLASEREARSSLENCRNKCLTTVGLTRRPDTDATEMIILCLHVRAAPVVFGRAWRRDLHHVYRASINTIEHSKKECSKMNYLHSVIKKQTKATTILNKCDPFCTTYYAKSTPKILLKHTPKCPK